MYIEVTRTGLDSLTKQVFYFDASTELGVKGIRVRLSRWINMRRQSRRHRTWMTTAEWSSNNFSRRSNIEAVKPAIPDGVRAEVLERLREGIHFAD